jgi:hypothetical protein
MASEAYQEDGLIVITFDEGDIGIEPNPSKHLNRSVRLNRRPT